MKWKTRSGIYNLLAGLTALTCSAGCNNPSVALLATKTIDFPAASGIEYYNNRLYVFGDNATQLLVLTPDYQKADSLRYWPGVEAIIEKDDKPDIESAMILERNNKALLVGVGSMSNEKRWNAYEYSFGEEALEKKPYFRNETVFPGIEELNIEGSTAFGNSILLCNRANLTTKKNHFLFWNGDSVSVKEVRLPTTTAVAGLSGLYYVKEKDLLLFTASEEATANATEDGAIGESYLGWLKNFTKQNGKALIKPDGFLRLSSFDKAFHKQKIESVCAEKVTGNSLQLHLVADNDNGKSVFFKIRLQL